MNHEQPAPSIFESVRAIRVAPGDVVLFRNPGRLDNKQREYLAGLMDELFPDNESVILEGGQDIAIVRTQQPGALRRLLGRG